MLTLMSTRQIRILNKEQGKHKREDGDAKVERIQAFETIIIRLDDLVLELARGESMQDANVALRLLRDTEGQAEPAKFQGHDVLERGAADADADGHAELAHEGVHARRGGLVPSLAHGLRGEVLRVQHRALARSDDQVRDHPYGSAVVHRPDDEESGPDAGDEPA